MLTLRGQRSVAVGTVCSNVVKGIDGADEYTGVVMVGGTGSAGGTLAQSVTRHLFHSGSLLGREQSAWFLSFAA